MQINIKNPGSRSWNRGSPDKTVSGTDAAAEQPWMAVFSAFCQGYPGFMTGELVGI